MAQRWTYVREDDLQEQISTEIHSENGIQRQYVDYFFLVKATVVVYCAVFEVEQGR